MICNNNSPLESLAAFAIVLMVGAGVSAVSLVKYIEKIRRETPHAIEPN